ncbi:MAG: pyridoxal-phosphate dependent enzyme, partial [Devosia sp.]|nr:pyridoxal-phosphate dependent enzyme [Devosia sp.]
MISLDDIRAAAERIAGHVRRTPVIAADQVLAPIAPGAEVTLKLELLQVTGSFKARGATNKLLSMSPAELKKGIVTASGGNHGIATARAGHMAGVPTTIFLPANASPAKIEKIKSWGADMRIVGSAWHEANVAALEFVAKS